MQSVYANRIVMLDIDTNGRIEERIPGTGQESWLDRTLLGAMYPNIHVALVSVPTEPLDDCRGGACGGSNDCRVTQRHCLQNGRRFRVGQKRQVLLLRRST